MVHAGCVFVADIHLTKTWMSGSLESVPWNACVHRLDLGLYSYLKSFGGIVSETKLTAREKSPVPEAQRRFEPVTLHHTRQPAQLTTDWAISAPTQIDQNVVITYV